MIVIAGRSMEPTLLQGWLVRINDAQGEAAPGAIVLLQGKRSLIVHRIVHRCVIAGSEMLFHRGDLEGGIGVARGTTILGRVMAVLEPEGMPIPTFTEMPRDFKRRFWWARTRCRAAAASWRAACFSGVAGTNIGRRLGGLARRVILGY
jgi:hypothetical protein